MSSRTFQAGDRVLISSLKSAVTRRTWLSPPLRETPPPTKPVSETNKTPNGYPPNTPLIHLNFGKLAHSDIIGRVPSSQIFELVTSQKGLSAKYRVSNPTLEEYINLSARKAQPIYALDAAAIVTLMDMHVDAPQVEWVEGKPHVKGISQFLEAGTGHGSLSLAIARQLQAANALARIMPDADSVDYRGAILHSVDCNKTHSHQGRETVEGFRRGQYAQNVEFHLSESPSEWVATEGLNWAPKSIQPEGVERQVNGSAWLDGVFLDMPSYHTQLRALCQNLKIDGRLITFCPSINQILDGIKEVDAHNETTDATLLAKHGELPFTAIGGIPAKMVHEKTIQLLPGMGGGLQEWDTRKTLIKATGEVGYTVRPKVGMRTVAGGFVCVWRKVGLEEKVYGRKANEVGETNENESNETNKSVVTESIDTDIDQTAEADQDVVVDTLTSAATTASTSTSESESSLPIRKFKPYTFEPAPVSSAPVSDFMKRFLSEEPLPAPETQRLELTPEEEAEAAAAAASSAEYEINEDVPQETRIFPLEALHTVYKNCSGEVHVGYVTRVNVVDVGKLPDYAFEGQIKPTGPENASS